MHYAFTKGTYVAMFNIALQHSSTWCTSVTLWAAEYHSERRARWTRDQTRLERRCATTPHGTISSCIVSVVTQHGIDDEDDYFCATTQERVSHCENTDDFAGASAKTDRG